VSILSTQAAILAALATVERAGERVFRAVLPHGGRFDLDALRRYTASSPAVMVSCLGGSVVRGMGSAALDAEWAAFLVAQDSVTSRVTTALGAVDVLATTVAENPWGANVDGAPSQIRVQNLYSAGTDARGVSLWAVTWVQRITLDEEPANYEDLLSVVWGLDDPDTTADPDIDSVVEVPHV
jgi:phage gp37-like protein